MRLGGEMGVRLGNAPLVLGGERTEADAAEGGWSTQARRAGLVKSALAWAGPGMGFRTEAAAVGRGRRWQAVVVAGRNSGRNRRAEARVPLVVVVPLVVHDVGGSLRPSLVTRRQDPYAAPGPLHHPRHALSNLRYANADAKRRTHNGEHVLQGRRAAPDVDADAGRVPPAHNPCAGEERRRKNQARPSPSGKRVRPCCHRYHKHGWLGSWPCVPVARSKKRSVVIPGENEEARRVKVGTRGPAT
ncbi:hypothetical protein C8R44DRAFT_786926, partial [Mycena epipterygia]